jgi:glutamine synthetase
MGPRIVLRSPDGACNPYLVLAGCLAAGLEGIKNQILPPISLDEQSKGEDVKYDILPRTLMEAIREFEKDEFLHRVYGKELTRIMIERKREEWNEFCEQVTAWEVEKYLDRI